MRDLIRHILRELLFEEQSGIRLTTDQFVERSNIKHNKKYDYSKSIYKNQKTPILITCPIHGDFLQSPQHHMNGSGCQKCGKVAKLTNDDFIDRARKVHGNDYDYSKTNYKNSSTKVKIICPKHGEFLQSPVNHLTGSECPKCALQKRAKERTFTTEDFIEKSRKIHGNKYDYSNSHYVRGRDKVKIICPFHGEFEQNAQHHMNGSECPKCMNQEASTRQSLGTDEFIKRSIKRHGNKYDYSKTVYRSNMTPVTIICKKHGEFSQYPKIHMDGSICPKCSGRNKDTKDFIDQAKKTHGEKYDYSMTEYKGARQKVFIGCPIHGTFLQDAANHLNGAGCPSCKESKGEKLLSELLKNLNILFERQKTFIDCTNEPGIGVQCKKLPYDFYIPSMNAVIEYDGEQHFMPVTAFGGQPAFERLQRLDKIRNQYCKKNGIKLIRIPYTMNKEEIEPYILKELGIK